jgi:hypothetical protein
MTEIVTYNLYPLTPTPSYTLTISPVHSLVNMTLLELEGQVYD